MAIIVMKTNSAIPFFMKPITRAIAGRFDSMLFFPEFKKHFGLLESQLASSPDGGEYLCGKDLTAADILISFAMTASKENIKQLEEQGSSFPKLKAYTKKLEENEVYLRSIKKVEEVTGEPASISF